MTDGASAVLLATEAWAREHKLPVLAFLSYGKVAAVDFVEKKEGLLMAPAYAVPRMLADAKTLQAAGAFAVELGPPPRSGRPWSLDIVLTED